MLTSSVSFSQSIRNSLRLKKLQAQAKNFCRVLDIRVSQIVKAQLSQTMFFNHQGKVSGHEIWLHQFANIVYKNIV